MKTAFPNSAKRVISLVLSLVMLVGTLFVANVGVNINASAETATQNAVEKTEIIYWDTTTATAPTKTEGTNQYGNPIYIIEKAEELNYVCTKIGASATGKTYKIADNIKAFILQPKSWASKDSDSNGTPDIMEMNGYQETKEYFENLIAAGTTPNNWVINGESAFCGDFDGNGVEIYGLYADGTDILSGGKHYNRQSAALFPNVDGGGSNVGGTFYHTQYATNYNYDTVGSSFTNFAIRNSYYKTWYRVGAVFGTTYYVKGGATVEGTVKLNGIEVTGCYMLQQDNYYNEDTLTTGTKDNAEMGVLFGSAGNDPTTVSNCFVKDNYVYHSGDSKVSNYLYGQNYTKVLYDSADTETRKVVATLTASVENSIVLGASPLGSSSSVVSQGNYSNVFTDQTTTYTTVVTLASADDTKGAIGKTKMSKLNWATDATAGNGTIQWYAIEDDYPTLFMPAGWKDTVKGYSLFSGSEAADYESGSGTLDDPYIIKTADQLYKMVRSSGKDASGNSQYFKVADGVEKLFLNDILSDESLDGIKDLVAKGSSYYKNWDANSTFFGKFDGNGVTISGMVSYDKNAFISDMQGKSEIRNIKFENCYVYDSAFAAIVTTKTGGSYKEDHTPVIANVSVRHSYIESTKADTTSPFLAKKTYNDSDGTQFVIIGDVVNANNDYATTLSDGTAALNASANAGGIVAFGNTTKNLIVKNCLFDGRTSEIKNGSTSTVDGRAGIVAAPSGVNNYEVFNSVSLGYPVVSEAVTNEGVVIYNRYSDWYAVNVVNCYTDAALNTGSTYASRQWDMYYETKNNVARLANKNAYESNELPLLDWLNTWSLVTDDTYTIPMPIHLDKSSVTASYTQLVSSGDGANPIIGGGYVNGTYGMYTKYIGSGTPEDPYLITNALELARAIGCGGIDINKKLYYKLTCDIDLVGAMWINQKSSDKYTYVPFEGVIDGAGHIVSNFSAIDTTEAGFIPVLNGGTVKNLHIRGAYAGSSNKAGVLVGQALNNPTITGCSVENSLAIASNSSALFVGTGAATITDSYYIADGVQTFYDESGANKAPTAFYPAENAKWYKGAENEACDGLPRLVNMAKAHSVTDIDGDGELGGEFYQANDLVALRRCMLGHNGYANVYGDVNGDDRISISDLSLVHRQMTDTYNSINDGFWRNLELGNVAIYYGENDNYDAARKLELALETAVEGVDIMKVVVANSTVTGTNSDSSSVYVHKNDIDINNNTTNVSQDKLDKYALSNTSIYKIVVGDISGQYATSCSDNIYKITKEDNNVYWLQGGSFTGVEQAAIDFAKNSNADGIYTIGDTALNSKKNYVEVPVDTNFDGAVDSTIKYYYAWGDEFDNTGDNQLTNKNWLFSTMNPESKSGTTGAYNNVEMVNRHELYKVYEVSGDGVLSIKRAYVPEYADGQGLTHSDAATLGYVALDSTLHTGESFGCTIEEDDVYASAGSMNMSKSLLWKQGYAEMYGTLPSDGHTFASWWMYGHNNRNNSVYDATLWSKVYRLNPNWNGANVLDSSTPETYKYQLEQSYYEIDIWELMQAARDASTTAGTYNYNIWLNIHKYYDTGVFDSDSDSVKDAVKLLVWGNDGAYSYKNYTYDSLWYNDRSDSGTRADVQTTTIDTFKTTTVFSEDGPNRTFSFNGGSGGEDYEYTYTYNGGIASTSSDVSSGKGGIFSSTVGLYNTRTQNGTSESNYSYNDASQIRFTAERRYGFYWNTNGVDKMNFSLYIYDPDGDGIVDEDGDGTLDVYYVGSTSGTAENYDVAIVSAVNDITYDQDSEGSKETLSKIINIFSDAEVANQYMYFIFDNIFYTSNRQNNGSMYTDLLTKENNNETTTLTVDYLRVYQQDGKRDIVTPETEYFNNNNHFGY